MKAYIINLKHSTARKEAMQKEIDRLLMGDSMGGGGMKLSLKPTPQTH